jgi:hypothetical protein
MADPLSVIASAVGIIVPALHGTRLLLEDLQQLKDAPKTVKRLVEDVQSVDTALTVTGEIGFSLKINVFKFNSSGHTSPIITSGILNPTLAYLPCSRES